MQLSGYPCGADWLKEFISVYESSYGEKPPVDVWAIDAYPIDWVRTPNNADEHAPIVFSQLEGMRQYLNTIPEYADTPIWITEIAVHVGYDGWNFDPFPNIVPIQPYKWDKMSEYLIAILDWLEVNAFQQQDRQMVLLRDLEGHSRSGGRRVYGNNLLRGP